MRVVKGYGCTYSALLTTHHFRNRQVETGDIAHCILGDNRAVAHRYRSAAYVRTRRRLHALGANLFRSQVELDHAQEASGGCQIRSAEIRLRPNKEGIYGPSEATNLIELVLL